MDACEPSGPSDADASPSKALQDAEPPERSRHRLFVVLILFLAAVVFLLDLLTPMGYGIWMLYLPLVLVTASRHSQRLILFASGLFSLLIIADRIFIVTDNPVAQDVALASAAFGLASVWTATFAAIIFAGRLREANERLEGEVFERKQSEELVRQLNENLEQQVRIRTAEAEERSEKLSLLAHELIATEERERRHLAYLIHDELQQLLVAVKLRLSLAASKSAREAMSDEVEEAATLINDCIQQSRSLTSELSPTVLYEEGLPAAIAWLAVWMRDKHKLEVAIECVGDAQPANHELGMFLFRAVRELLFNVVKHADAASARVTLEPTPDGWIRAMVEDRGPGFDAAATASHAARGFGLFSIRERLEFMGGRMAIESAPGAGTRVTLLVPAAEVERSGTRLHP